MEPEELHVWKIQDSETHWYVARDKMDALILFDADMDGDYDVNELVVTMLLDDHPLIISTDDGDREIKTCVEWTKEGRGLLCSTCW